MGKGGGTQGYRYYMSLLSGLCRGPIDEVVAIRVGDEDAWDGHACDTIPYYIDKPDLFGGDDKEGGVQGPFSVFMGARDQVLPGAQGSLPSVKASIGGRVSEMRGTAMLWFDGMVAAMNPYLKEWKFRVRRSQSGWYGAPWYRAKATIYMGGDNLTVDTNRPIDFPVVFNDDGSYTITFSRNAQDGDKISINGLDLTFVSDDPATYELKPNKDRERTVRNIANFINGKSTAYRATATYTADTVTIKADQAGLAIYAANASHIVYECYTNPEWGRGLPLAEIDEPSFIYAANKLCAEGFGICLAWYRKEDIDQFIQKICDLVGATTYTDRETGKMVFRLVRDDYNIEDVPLFTPDTGLLSIDLDDSNSSDDNYNEIIGTSRDPISNLDFQVRAQNPAAYQSQGAPSSLDQDYKGIPTKALLARVVLRDLRAMASGLKKYNVTLDRRGWRVAPGSVIRISHPKRGLTNLVLRVGEIDDGNMVNGSIKIKAAIDVFGLPATSYTGETGGGWVAPSKVAVPASEERLVEASFRDLYQRLGQADAEAAEPTNAYIGQLARAPNPTSLQYDLATKAEGEADYTVRARGDFTGCGFLVSDIGPLDTAIVLTDTVYFGAENVGQAILIGDEIVALDAWDDVTKTMTVRRGAGDTIPAAHESGDPAWTIDDDLVADGVVWAEGDTIDSKVLTRTSAQVLDMDLADEMEIDLVARHARPYPPSNVQIGGTSIYAMPGEQPEPEITWGERNRLTQADSLIGHVEATVTPEVGTTYNLRVLHPISGDVLREETGLTDTTFTYDSTMQAADAPPSNVIVELESERDGLTSYQHYRFPVVLQAGWGYGWGLNWGGG